jgi:tetratricopeptide (TPR) repeat protein
MFRSRILLVILVCSIACCVSSQESKDAKKTTLDASTTTDHSLEAYVIEQMRTVCRFENDGTGMRETYVRVKVQSEAGVARWGQVIIGYNSASERVEIPFVRVLKKDGTKVTAPTDSIQDLSAPVEREAPVYTDFRQKQVPVSGLRPGEVVEYDVVSIVHTAMAPGQFWAQYGFTDRGIVLDERLEINVPGERKITLKTKPGLDPKISSESGRRIYRWTHSHLISEATEEETEKKNKGQEKTKKKDDDRPDVQLTTFDDWDAVGHWYSALERDRRSPNDEIRAKANELTKGATTDLDKVQALYDYVAKNFRYVSLSLGLGRYQPHSATDIFHNQYGDCKDKNTLLAAMLEAEGIHSSSVLINSSRKLDPEVPSPIQFDHAITVVPVANRTIWLDSTTEIAPFQFLTSNLRDKQALVIAPAGTARLDTTPADPPVPTSDIQSIEGKVNDLGKLEARVHFVERGDAELILRMVFRRSPQSRWKTVVETMSGFMGFSGEVSDLKVSDPADTREPFEISYNLEKANYLDWSQKKVVITLPASSVNLPVAVDDDTDPSPDPLKLGATGISTLHMRLELPAKYTGRPPLPFSMSRDYAAYEANYKLEKNVFTADRKMTIRQREVALAQTPGYIAFRRAVMADAEQKLTLETAVAGAPSLPDDVTANDLNDAATEALKNGNYQIAIDVLKRAVEIDPKHKYAWNNLGRAYLGMQRIDDAIPAFQKQIEINPYDEYAYNNLGRAYRFQRRYELAVEQFRKQIEVNPLDEYAHANLGGTFVDWKKYDEAVPELEKAASINSEESFTQIQLGNAYLNLGQDDKAIAAFDRALEISATPGMWNDIAYGLAMKGTHLDKAKQYAESAVTSLSASLRNVQLAQLSLRDLGLIPSLSACWDTLGWVYFAAGDLDMAERYIKSSWMLDQHAEVGDHLGQIYEKRGQKDLAIHAYALALSSFRPDADTRKRLSTLLGDEGKVDAEIARVRRELEDLHTVTLTKSSGDSGHADFFVLLEPSAKGSLVSATKFISGDEKLKAPADAWLRASEFRVGFPDATPTKLFLRGTVTCAQSPHPCVFVTTVPDEIRSVN